MVAKSKVKTLLKRLLNKRIRGGAKGTMTMARRARSQPSTEPSEVEYEGASRSSLTSSALRAKQEEYDRMRAEIEEELREKIKEEVWKEAKAEVERELKEKEKKKVVKRDGKKVYCGLKAVPQGQVRGTFEECAKMGDLSYYGLASKLGKDTQLFEDYQKEMDNHDELYNEVFGNDVVKYKGIIWDEGYKEYDEDKEDTSLSAKQFTDMFEYLSSKYKDAEAIAKKLELSLANKVKMALRYYDNANKIRDAVKKKYNIDLSDTRKKIDYKYDTTLKDIIDKYKKVRQKAKEEDYKPSIIGRLANLAFSGAMKPASLASKGAKATASKLTDTTIKALQASKPTLLAMDAGKVFGKGMKRGKPLQGWGINIRKFNKIMKQY